MNGNKGNKQRYGRGLSRQDEIIARIVTGIMVVGIVVMLYFVSNRAMPMAIIFYVATVCLVAVLIPSRGRK